MTLPSPGVPFQSGQTISSAQVNSTFTDLATETSDSLSRSGKGPMLMPLRLPDGSMAIPSLAFTGEQNSGMWRAGPTDVRLVVGGVDALKLGVGGIAGDLSLSGVAVPVIKTTFSNSQLQIQGNRAAADVGSDVGIGSTVARTAGYLAAFQNPISTTNKLLVDWQGLLTLASPAAAIQPASLWTVIVPNTGWTANNGLAYWKDANGMVHLKGYVTGAAVNPAITLPVGFRPSALRYFRGSNAGGDVHISVDVTGAITCTTGAGASTSAYVDPVSFLAEQ